MNLYFLLNSLAGGGAERVAVNLSKSLNVKRIFLLERDVKYNVPYDKLSFLSNHKNSDSSTLKTFYIPLYAKKLSKHIEEDSIVLSFLERANYVNVLSKIYKKHLAYISVHMSQLKGRARFHPYNILTKLFYPKADKVICVSKGIARELKLYFNVPEEKLLVIYNPIYKEDISTLSKEPLTDYEAVFTHPVILSSGRLTKPKGQWYLIRILKVLKRSFPELRLVILGEGELKDYLVSLSEELGLKTYVWDRDSLSEEFDVYFLGFQKNPFKFVAKSMLFVFPSLYEGFGNVLVEAMACGVPVVSADCRSGPREILAPNTDFEYQTTEPEYAEYGILMPVFDVEFKRANEPLDDVERMWVETLKDLLLNEELRKTYAKKAMQRAQDFDMERIAKEWMKILNV